MVFFLPLLLSGWVRTGKAGRSKKLSKTWINSSVNLSWAFPSDVQQKVPPAQATGRAEGWHQKAKCPMKMLMMPGCSGAQIEDRPKHTNIPDAPSHTQLLLGVAPCCLAAAGSGEEYFQVLLIPNTKYIKPCGSTNTEAWHSGRGGNMKAKKAADYLKRLGACQCGYLQQNNSSPTEPQPPAQSHGACYCSWSKDLLQIWKTPDGSQSCCLQEAGLCLWCCLDMVAKDESFLNVLPI